MTNLSLVSDIVESLRRLFPDGAALHEPDLSGSETRYLSDCINSGFVSSVGAYVNRFEKALADYVGAKHAIAVVNGTSALHCAMLTAGVRRGDEVIVPAFGFVAIANAVAYCGARPHFVDSSFDTLGVDPERLLKHLRSVATMRDGVCTNKATGARIAAVACVHTFGHPLDLAGLMDACAEFDLLMIEDASEALGSLYRGRHTGTFGRIGALSFNGNKIITTGGGGAIITDDDDIAAHAKHLSTTAKIPHSWEYVHDETGFNYRMPNINAALGCAQLEKLPTMLDHKRALADAYRGVFANLTGGRLICEPAGCRSNYWLNAVLVDDSSGRTRDDILRACHDGGVFIRGSWRPMHRLDMYRSCPQSDLSVTDQLYARLVCLPSSASAINAFNAR